MAAKYFMKIDRASIKINPNAGSRMSRVMGRRDVTFDCVGELPKELIDGTNVAVTVWQDRNGKRFHSHGFVLDVETETMIWEKLRAKEWPGFSMNMEQQSQTIHHQPIPKYSYVYIDPAVVCRHCGWCCMANQLETEEIGFGDFSTTVCPKCGGWDCCELEYENINDVTDKPE